MSFATSLTPYCCVEAPFYRLTTLGDVFGEVSKGVRPAMGDHPSPVWDAYPKLWPIFEQCWKMEPEARIKIDDLLEKLQSLTA